MMLINYWKIVKLLVNRYDLNCVIKLRSLMLMSKMLVLCIWASVENILMLLREELCNSNWLKGRSLLSLGMRNWRVRRLFDLRLRPRLLSWSISLSGSSEEHKLKLRSWKLHMPLLKCCPRILISHLSPLTVPLATCLTLKFDLHHVISIPQISSI